MADFYHPDDEGGILWKDKEIRIKWSIPKGMPEGDLVLSEKDTKWGGMKEYLKERKK